MENLNLLNSVVYISNDKRTMEVAVANIKKVDIDIPDYEEKTGVVIRIAMYLPEIPANADYVIDSRGYHASSSEGNFSVVPYKNTQKFLCVGFMELGRALKPVHPFYVYIVSDGECDTLETFDHSNYDLVNAIWDVGVDYYENNRPGEGCLVCEGQSDYLDIFRIENRDNRNPKEYELFEEFQTDIINSQTIEFTQIRKAINHIFWSYSIKKYENWADYVIKVCQYIIFPVREDLKKDIREQIVDKYRYTGDYFLSIYQQLDSVEFFNEDKTDYETTVSLKKSIGDVTYRCEITGEENVQKIQELEKGMEKYYIRGIHPDDEEQKEYCWEYPADWDEHIEKGMEVEVDTAYGARRIKVIEKFVSRRDLHHKQVLHVSYNNGNDGLSRGED